MKISLQQIVSVQNSGKFAALDFARFQFFGQVKYPSLTHNSIKFAALDFYDFDKNANF